MKSDLDTASEAELRGYAAELLERVTHERLCEHVRVITVRKPGHRPISIIDVKDEEAW